jgi:c-di-AMP phosphodiesterase-like protein
MKYTILQFIPIILLFLLLSYPEQFALFSNLSVGRLIAVIIIVFYSSLDKYVGLLVCGLVILFYQSDYVENMMPFSENFVELSYSYLQNVDNTQHNNKNIEIAKVSQKITETQPLKYAEYLGLYLNKPIETAVTKNDVKQNANPELKEQFRKQYCDGNVLKYKNTEIKPDMMQHIFPQVSFISNHCNPCDKSCEFSIIESKLMTEEQMKPISTLP